MIGLDRLVNGYLLSRTRYAVVRIDSYRRLNPGTAFSQHLEALTLAVVAKVREPSFIQIGANDGQLADDFGPLIKKYGLRGTWGMS